MRVPSHSTKLRETADRFVRGGYDDPDEIVWMLAQLMGDEDKGDIRRIVGDRWAERIREQDGWPEVTDNDRLDRAFARLAASRIVAEQNFGCCKRCGLTEIGAGEDLSAVDGFTFFHEQDTDRAVDGGPLYLAFGSFTDDDRRAEIGERVVAALQAEGLETEWDGSPSQRIIVRLTWRKRLPSEAGAAVRE